MDVLVVAVNRCKEPFPVVPYGACLAAEAAQRAGHQVWLLDLMFAKDPLHALAEALRQRQPRVVGFSVRNIDNNDLRHTVNAFEEVAPLVGCVRRHCDATVVLGGAAVAVMPEALLRHSGADLAAIGDGEVVFPDLLAALARGEDGSKVPGVARLEGGVFRRNPPAAAAPCGDCPAPDFGRWVALRDYAGRMAAVPLQTKRGCPFTCVYCTYNALEGRDYRLCAPESVAEAVSRLAAAGARDIEFVDNVFNAPYAHALAVCEHLARARLPVRFQSIELNPRFLDGQLLHAMERAGFTGIGITAESAADPVLQGLGKGFTSAQVHRAAEVVRRRRLPCLWIFLLGGPGETPETVRETLAFAARRIRPSDVAFFNVGVRIYPGTPLERLAREQGVLSAPPSEMLRPVFYLSPEIRRDWLAAEMERAMGANYHFANGDVLNSPLLRRVNRWAGRLKMAPPLWRRTSALRRVLDLAGVRVHGQ